MTDAIELLRRDHDEVRRLLAELEARADLADARGQQQRRATVDQVIIRASKHEAIEEQHFWPVVRRRRPHPGIRPDPDVQRLASRIAGATDRIRDVLAGRNGS